jgi:hypothetical protein
VVGVDEAIAFSVLLMPAHIAAYRRGLRAFVRDAQAAEISALSRTRAA